MTPERENFIIQDTSDIFKESSKLRKFSNMIINEVAQRANIIANGGELKDDSKKLNYKSNNINMNIKLSAPQIRKLKKQEPFIVSYKNLTSDTPNFDIEQLPDKQRKAVEKAIRTNKGVKFTSEMIGGSVFSQIHKKVSEKVKKSLKDASFDEIIEGDGFFKKMSKGIKKGNKAIQNTVKTVKSEVKKAPKTIKAEVNDKGNRKIVGRKAKELGKESLKYVAKEGLKTVIAAPIAAGTTFVTGNPALGNAVGKFASSEIMERSGANKKLDKKINGLGTKRPAKGTAEMKEYMANMRSKKKTGGSFRAPSGNGLNDKISASGSFRAPKGKGISGGALISDAEHNNNLKHVVGLTSDSPMIQNETKYLRKYNGAKMVGKGFLQ